MHRTCTYLRCGRVCSDRAGEAFPSGKRCRGTTELGGFAHRQNVLFQFPQHISRTQGKSVKHEVLSSLGPWHHDQVTACQSCSQPLEKTAWEKQGNPYHCTALPSDLSKRIQRSTRKERRSACIHSSHKEHLSGQALLLLFTAGGHHHMP